MPPSLAAALMPFQAEGVRYGLERRGRVLIADEMGVGKTVQAMALASCYMVRGTGRDFGGWRNHQADIVFFLESLESDGIDQQHVNAFGEQTRFHMTLSEQLAGPVIDCVV